MPHITLLALPNALASSLALPMEMLTAADNLVRTQLHRHTPSPPNSRLHCDVVGPGGDSDVATASGLTLKLSGNALDISVTDLLIIPALWRNPLTTLRRYSELQPWLQRLAQHNTHLCAVGTGSFFLAEAGLLTHKPATTHWFYFDQFERRYPHVQLQRRHLITEAGNIFCAGSVNSVADLTIHFIELYYGAQVARKVEAQFSPEIRRPFESHVYVAGRADLHADELVAQAQDMLRGRYTEPLNIAEIAHELGISTRSLNRHFKNATGLTPGLYLQQQRLSTARELLRTSNLSIAEVANAVGYTDSDYFCRRFRDTMNQTPSDYRASVRGKLFSVTRQS
ncbi:MAG TPA: helix-turn-helix domain-containing protein [Spongiibacteraceae bacterium]|nr:helix-turn-helix domain-containing protein [Spongiibacteraceae bacterium]